MQSRIRCPATSARVFMLSLAAVAAAHTGEYCAGAFPWRRFRGRDKSYPRLRLEYLTDYRANVRATIMSLARARANYAIVDISIAAFYRADYLRHEAIYRVILEIRGHVARRADSPYFPCKYFACHFSLSSQTPRFLYSKNPTRFDCTSAAPLPPRCLRRTREGGYT